MEGPVRVFKFNLFSNNLLQIRKYQVIQIQQTQRWLPFALKQVLIREYKLIRFCFLKC
jgi:hypothetical protein